MKHIAVNTRLLLGGRLEGIGRFASEVLQRMVARNPDVRFSFFFDRPYDSGFLFGENVEAIVLPPQARHPLLWYAWFHVMLRHKLDRLRPDVFFSPEFYLSSHPSIPQVPVFHDLAYEHYPQDLPRFASWYCRRYSPRYARRADQLLTVSEYSKQDIVSRYCIAPEKISVVYNGVSARFRPVPEAEQQAARAQYAGGAPFFHFVGAIHPRKNIENLLRAFDHFKQAHPSPVKLLIVGRKGWRYAGAMEVYEHMTHRDAVVFTGYVPDEALSSLYAASLGLCYVPYLEGFGIPILEAMHSETAVICSGVSAMPEVAGDAALLVDPFSVPEIAGAMAQLYHQPALRLALIGKGRVQREQFSWDLTYEKVWKVLSGYL